jgi:hypothetical protein
VCSSRRFLKGTSDGQSRRDYKEDIFVIMGSVQGDRQSRETTTNRMTSFSSLDVFKGMGDQGGETTNRTLHHHGAIVLEE